VKRGSAKVLRPCLWNGVSLGEEAVSARQGWAGENCGLFEHPTGCLVSYPEQEGIVNDVAAALAIQAGLLVVMDRCWLKEYTARSDRG